MPGNCARQIMEVYRRMAEELNYRPEAPSDGMGNITVPIEECVLEDEQAAYAQHWWAEEESRRYTIGVPHYPYRPTLIASVEAAKACCSAGPEVIRETLLFALRLLDEAEEGERNERAAA